MTCRHVKVFWCMYFYINYDDDLFDNFEDVDECKAAALNGTQIHALIKLNV